MVSKNYESFGDSPADWKIAFETIDLQALVLGSTIRVDEVALHGVRLEAYRERVLQNLVLHLRAHVWAEPPKQVSVRYPRTWWDAFKERFFPEWLQEAYPVDYTVEIMEGQIFYPKLRAEVPAHCHNLRLVVRKLV